MPHDVMYSSMHAPIEEMRKNSEGIMQIMQQHNRKNGSTTVDRTDGTIQETTIHQTTFRNGHKNRLVYPSGK